MKKNVSRYVLLSVLALVFLVGLSGIAHATVDVTPEHWYIGPNQSNKIFIHNYTPDRIYTLYSVRVIRPDTTEGWLYPPAGTTIGPYETLTVTYPNDWVSPPAGWTSTGTAGTELGGKYKIWVHGRTTEPWDKNAEFDVTKFSVVPEFGIGVAAIVSLSFAGLLMIKRRFKTL